MNLPQSIIKNFRAQLREQQEQERQAEQEKQARRAVERAKIDYCNQLRKGAKVKYSQCIDIFTGKPIIQTGYLTYCDPESYYIWIADTKEEALNGYGATINKNSIII